MDNKIIFLGAGASKDAGYPLTFELDETLEHFIINYAIFHHVREAGEIFKEGMRVIREILSLKEKEMISIEYRLSIIELLKKINEQWFHEQWEEALSYRKNNEYREEDQEKWKGSYSKISQYESFIIALQNLIGEFLTFENEYMEKSCYKYLVNFFQGQHLSKGDTVITLNYDLLAERALFDLELWSPRDGYAFRKEFRPKCTYENTQKISQKSKVKLLKLHGSVGWMTDKIGSCNSEISLEEQRLVYRRIFGCRTNNETNHPQIKDHNHYMVLPTFIKTYAHPDLLEIWSNAAKAISHAKEIHFVGFSLPEYDYNVKTLLLPLRNQNTAITVYLKKGKDMKKEENRYKDFLGEAIQIIEIDSFKEYCEKNYGNCGDKLNKCLGLNN